MNQKPNALHSSAVFKSQYSKMIASYSYRLVLLSLLVFLFCIFSKNILAQSIIINGANSICQGEFATFTIADGYTPVRWSTGATTRSIIVNTAGSYSVTVTDAQNNQQTESKTLTVNPSPVPDISGVPYVCYGRATSLLVEGNYRAVQWSNGERVELIYVSTPATYSVTVVDYNSCSGTSSVTVRDGSRPYNALPDSVKICQGDSSILDASTNAAISYYWNTTDTTPTVTVRDSGRYNVIISTGQCVNYDTVYVLTLPPPIVNLGIDTAICAGDILTLRAEQSPLYTYLWNDNSILPTLDVKNEGIYSVEVSFGRCRSGDTIDITIFDKRQGMVLDTIICTPQYVINGALRGAKAYKWNVGSTDSILQISKTGIYNLLANNSKCYVNQNFNIRFKKTPLVELGKDSVLCQDLGRKSLLLVAGIKGEADYQWQDNSTNNTFQVVQSGVHTVRATNECGEVSDAVRIDIRDCYHIFIPTAFSPNGDGVNDVLQIFPSENVLQVNVFHIFDRWGNQIFSAAEFSQSETGKNTWDGRVNNRNLPPDVFVYYIEYTTTDGNKIIQKGDITLMR